MKKILIVDDREDTVELLEMTLKRGDYKVFRAGSGESALEIAGIQKPDLIIMDVMMPGKIDGLEATRIIKGNPETRHCKVIMISGKGLEVDREAGLQAGAQYYFMKPFSPLELIKQVDEMLRN
ncbi:MAG: response regulator [Thermodesulfobacteriota bacterium]